jgi:hypothetical protein
MVKGSDLLKGEIMYIRVNADQRAELEKIKAAYHQDSMVTTVRMAIDNLISTEQQRERINKSRK